MGLTYDEVRAEVEAGRWRRVGRRTISTLGDAPLSERALWHRAIWEVGGGARLDGVTALKAWGLTKWDEDVVHVSVPRGARHRKVPGVRVHVLRELEIGEGWSAEGGWSGDDGAGGGGRSSTCVSSGGAGGPRGAAGRASARGDGRGIPRVSQPTATLRAAMWARTDRAAATLLAMAVQRRLVDTGRLLEAWRTVTRCPRRALLSRLVPLVAGGAHALSEIDFAVLGRARGWPEPARQVVVRTTQGRIYLDVRFTGYGVIVEVNGVQHYEAIATMADALRRNEHAVSDRTALEIPAVALILDPEPFLDQVEEALRRRGWKEAA